jgi:hypothetical protein
MIEYVNVINNSPDYPVAFDLDELPDQRYHYDFTFSHGILYSFSNNPLSKELQQIFVRFARLFSQTYQRYQDLVKAEEQAREAQIEAAVERVRAQALAMQEPNDIVRVTQTLVREISDLEIQKITGAAVILVDDDDVVHMWDISDPGNMGYSSENKSTYDPREFEMLGEFWRRWKNGDEYFVIEYALDEKTLEEWKKVDLENYLNLSRAMEQEKLKTQWNPFASFSKGLLTLDMMEVPNSDTENIIIKMAKTFDLAYQRFDDLQKAQQQADLARKQASLDRVRAEIASMRSTKDLEKITPLVWKELTYLDIPFYRCGVFIVDKQKKNIHSYLTTPSGDSIAAMTLKFDSSEVASTIVTYWSEQKVYKENWSHERFLEFSKSLVDTGLVESTESYASSTLPEGVVR